MLVINKRLIVTLIVSMVACSALILFDINPLFSISLALVAAIVVTYTKTVYRDFCMLFFCISFFFFIMSNEVIIELFHLSGGMRESTADANSHYLLVLCISLIGLLLGYQVIINNRISALSEISLDETLEKYRYRKVSRILFYLTFLLYLAPVVERILFVRNFSYYLSYVSYNSSMPVVLIKVGEMCPVFFAVYLATFPSKKECKFPVILYVVYACCYFLTGKRYQTVASMIFIIVYYLIRNKTDERLGVKWIRSSTIIAIFLILPFLGAGLAAYSTIRTGSSLTEGTTFGDLLYVLFTGVADSDKVIKYGYILKDSFPQGHFYSLGSVVDYFKYGTLSKLLFPSEVSVSQTAAYAMQGNGYSYTLSYLYYPERFLVGHGLGSCYIAELYQDMGYFGVFLGNVILGMAIRNVFTLSKNSVLKNAVVFYMFKLLMLTPRNDYDVILRELGSVSFLGSLVILNVVVQIYYRNKEDSLKRIFGGNH